MSSLVQSETEERLVLRTAVQRLHAISRQRAIGAALAVLIERLAAGFSEPAHIFGMKMGGRSERSRPFAGAVRLHRSVSAQLNRVLDRKTPRRHTLDHMSDRRCDLGMMSIVVLNAATSFGACP
jgi:hypothetical protein